MEKIISSLLQESKYKIGNLIGKGTYGNVFSDIENKYAIKISKIFENDTDITNKSWREFYIYNNLLNNNNKFLKLHEASYIKNFSLSLKKENYNGHCLQLVFDKADGTLKDYFQVPRTTKEVYSCILQILGILHYLQINYQLIHSDLKSSNIVYKKINNFDPIEYSIFDKKYKINHTGVLFYIIDFGVSYSLSPKYDMYWKNYDLTRSLGTRSVQIAGDMAIYKQSAILAIKKGCEKNLINSFVNNPKTYPPIEFSNDIQDLLSIFIQDNPSKYPPVRIPIECDKLLKTKYFHNVLKPYHILAGKLFEEIFTFL